MCKFVTKKLLTVLGAVGLVFALSTMSLAQLADRKIPELEGVGITEHLDEMIPLDIEFVDESGEKVMLGSYFDGEKPVLLILAYYECPMLCNLVVNGAVDAMKEIDLTPARDFEIVTVSFNPAETHTLAKLKKQNYVKDLGVPGAAGGWHFLTGRESNIRKLTDAVGFGYRWNEKRGEYAHSAALFILTPEGKLSRYLYGIMYEPETLRLSLLEASRGKIGTALDQLILYCFHYDSSAGKYSPHAINIMRLGGVLTLLVLGTTLSVFWLSKRRSARSGGSRADGGAG